MLCGKDAHMHVGREGADTCMHEGGGDACILGRWGDGEVAVPVPGAGVGAGAGAGARS